MFSKTKEQMSRLGFARILVLVILGFTHGLFSQVPFVKHDVFQTHYFIENKGQIHGLYKSIPDVKFTLEEGLADYLITKDGIAYVNQTPQILENSDEEEGSESYAEEDEESKIQIDTALLFQEFLFHNKQFDVLLESKSSHYFSYLEPRFRSYGYKKITFKNYYNSIDLVFVLAEKGKGLKYSFVVHPGGDPNQIQWRYKGDSIRFDASAQNQFIVMSNGIQLKESGLQLIAPNSVILGAKYQIKGDVFSFAFHDSISQLEKLNCIQKGFEIDPFVTIQANAFYFPRMVNEHIVNSDYDAFGNVYFYGAGLGWRQKVCKYTPEGTLLWTVVGTPMNVYMRFNSGPYGTIRVDRCNGKIYCMAGSGPPAYWRISTDGENDHYWSKPIEPEPSKEFFDINFVTKLKSVAFYCGAHKKNTAVYNVVDSFPIAREVCVTKDSTVGIGSPIAKNGRDYVHSAIDDFGNSFALLAQGIDAQNGIYNYSNKLVRIDEDFTKTHWEKKWGFTSFWEYSNCVVISNRVKQTAYSKWYVHNRFNALAVYDQYVYVFDGKHFAAFDKKDGSRLAVDSIAHLPIVQNSGMAVDSCNNLYLGADSGRVYVYRFDGKQFNSVKVIQVIADTTRNCRVYDVVYNYDAHMIYVSGDSFAAAVDCGTPCGNKIRLETSSYRSCGDPLWAKIINPDSTLTYTFEWRKPLKNELVRSVTGKYKFGDTLSNLTSNTNYRLYIFVSPFCTGTFKTKNFEVRSSFDSAMSLNICEGDTLVHNGKRSFQTGKYIDTLKTYFGCDSIVTYNLKVLSRSFVDSSANICLGDSVVMWGRAFRTSGIYRDTLINYLGCDSITTLKLRVSFDSTYQALSICLGDTIWVGSRAYSTSGFYRDTLRSSKNCDSLVLTQLTVNLPATTLTQLVFCNVDSLSYRGKNYALPFKLRDSLQTWQGCDSIFLLEVDGHWVRADFDIDSTNFPEYQFQDKSTGAKSHDWDFGDLWRSNLSSPVHTYVKSYQRIKYKVCLVVEDAYGCRDTICKELWVRPMKDVFIPEGISPNGDGVNDSLDFMGLWAFPNAEWTVFNRWGQVVFSADAKNPKSWTGRCEANGCNGGLLPEGVYFIVFDYHDGVHERVSANIYLKR
ncbi:MAG: hypothetical protein EBR94_01570 [Bacteroidetes bacterium]|nr:hypothetical protein [Bacteroidota bacterium]